MRMMLVLFTALILAFTSCEGFIHMQGRVTDNTTKQAVENVRVLLVLKGKDTLVNNKLYYDTIASKDRIVLRKNGIKDNYKLHDARGFSKFRPSQTDTGGYFTVGNILVPCVPECPACQLVFIKDGYQPLSIKLSSISQDNMDVVLFRTSDSSVTSKHY